MLHCCHSNKKLFKCNFNETRKFLCQATNVGRRWRRWIRISCIFHELIQLLRLPPLKFCSAGFCIQQDMVSLHFMNFIHIYSDELQFYHSLDTIPHTILMETAVMMSLLWYFHYSSSYERQLVLIEIKSLSLRNNLIFWQRFLMNFHNFKSFTITKLVPW